MTWALIGRFLLKHWQMIVLLALIGASATYMHHRGYVAGKESQAAVIADLKAANAAANTAYEAQKTLADARGAELAKRDAADAALARAADDAVKAAKAKEREANRALDSALDQLKRWSRVPKCKALLDTDLTETCGA